MKTLEEAINFGRQAAAEFSTCSADILLNHVDARLTRHYPNGAMPPELFAAVMIGVIYALCDRLAGSQAFAETPKKHFGIIDTGKGW